MLYFAIDQHSKQLTVNLRDEEGHVILKRQVSTRWEKIRQHLDDVRQRAAKQGGFVAIVEVCGFNDWLLKLLAEYDCREIVLIQPKKRDANKTDRRDAQQLGELLWVNRSRLLAGQRVFGIKRVRIPEADEQHDRQLTAMRLRVTRMRTKTINRAKQILRRHNLQQHRPTKGFQTQATQKWLTHLELSALDRLAMDHLLDQWKLWDQQLADLDKQIAERCQHNATARLLGSITGRAGFSSLALASRIGPIRDFTKPRSLANYWGLTPKCHNSGEATERLGSITKAGSPMARYVLGQLVLHVLRRDGQMRKWHRQIKLRRGSKIARVAVMRRLTTIIWHMVTHNEPYKIGEPVPRRKATSGPGEACGNDLESHREARRQEINVTKSASSAEFMGEISSVRVVTVRFSRHSRAEKCHWHEGLVAPRCSCPAMPPKTYRRSGKQPSNDYFAHEFCGTPKEWGMGKQ